MATSSEGLKGRTTMRSPSILKAKLPFTAPLIKPTFFPRVYVICAFLYLVIGNVARFLAVGSFTNNLLVTEFFLYAATLAIFLIYPQLLTELLVGWGFFFSFILLSFTLGSWQGGLEAVPLLYALRLILLLSSGFVLGYCLHRLNPNQVSAMKWFSQAYLALAIFGFIIYLAFPNSYELWQFLKNYGIEVNGDPHVRRFISSYFDPNYYGAIAPLGVITSLLYYHYSKSLRYLFIALFVALSILLSSSRSGIATFLAMTLFILFQVIKYLLSKRNLSLRLVTLVPLIFIGLLVLSPIYLEPIFRAWQRIVELDGSAQVRFNSFKLGQELFSTAPIFGLGYNYLVIYAERARGLSSVDSSVQATLINFGIIGTFFIIAYSVWFLIKLYTRLGQQPLAVQRPLRLMLWYLNSYVAVIFVFTSQFNNILYYQFWLLPVVALYSYCWFAAKSDPPLQQP
jgi:O-Antigen ligase